jgi:valyl-tRNA synthetase
MNREIPKAYEPQEIEKRLAREWVDERLFAADSKAPGPVFSIAIPPPNVTGSIHSGHMLEHTQIDIIVRWRRMQGLNTLWLPGCDHAGIATQVVVERELAKEGLKREDLGREEFERRVWEWKQKSGGRIREQMIRLGDSCDWTRERFTLDPPLYRAVLEAFLRLYHEGLIYRGRYMVNWCPRCRTALSDLEVGHQERTGKLWHIRYPRVDADGYVVVATTRPETLLGDTAVAVHPEDERYRSLVGRKLRLPLMNREIPVVADEFVDREFGTGAVKVTPAHDPNDFELGQRHNLPEIDVMTDDGKMNENAGAYAGLGRFEARERIVEDLREQGLLEKITDHTHAVGICDRCKTDVEPRISTQWFCRMKPLAEPAIQVVREGLIPIVPDNQKKIYLDWMENIRDWCISRQLWWGHRIPVWHCGDCGAMSPARDSRVEIVDGRTQAASPPERCEKCGSQRMQQDPDVLDTWFSSGLWPFSTLGWPDQTEDLERFYPTSLMINGYDILFFWDARMIMLGLHLTGGEKPEDRIPFRSLYLHAIVRDEHGVKMSKTRGNVVDLLEVIEKHGTDALRFTLAIGAAPGTDIALNEDRILGYRAFANKIWNAARFLFVNLEKVEAGGLTIEELAGPEVRARAPYRRNGELLLVERWMYSRLARVAGEVSDALEGFRFHEAAHVVYHFFWHEFCDWYIEWVKPRLAAADREDMLATWRNLFAIFDGALRLLHPFMPFLTEELWRRLPQRAGARSIALEQFPERRAEWIGETAESHVAQLQEIVEAARSLRAEQKIDPKKKVPADFFSADPLVKSLALENQDALLRLAGLSELRLRDSAIKPQAGTVRSTARFDLHIAPEEPADRQAEIARLNKQADEMKRDLESKRRRLADEAFRTRAPEPVVKQLEATIEQRQAEYEKLQARLAQLTPAAKDGAFDWDDPTLRALIRAALEEDIGSGDLTTAATVKAEARARARLVARQNLLLAGLPAFERIFRQLDSALKVTAHFQDGAWVPAGSVVAEIEGGARAILTGERTALNFLAHLSGIATLTKRFAAELRDTKTQLRDTRKTTPLYRRLEKYAVRTGGGTNHRFGLSDGVLIKENHIAAAGSVAEAIRHAREAARERGLTVEVEVRNRKELREALAAGADEILLDNMGPATAARMVALARQERPECRVEISGGVTLRNIRAYGRAGADFISVGTLTHSAPAADFSLLVEGTDGE